MNIKKKNIIVIGSGKSGISAAILANKKGAFVSLYDKMPFSCYKDSKKEILKDLEKNNIKLLLGVDIIKTIDSYDLIIKSPGVPMDLDFLLYSKNKNIPIIGEFEFASWFNKGLVCAITGTNGKTTTTSLVGSVLKAYKPSTHIVGNIGIAFSDKVLDIDENDFVVAEMSSFQLEAIDKFHPKISCILNLEEDHLNRHYTMENYIAMKKRIFENQDSNDFAVLNYDDIKCKKLANTINSKVVYFSRLSKLDRGVYVEDEYIIERIFNTKNIVCKVSELKILGDHNVENALAAVVMLTLLGVPTNIISKELIRFKGVEHRIEYVGSKNDIDFYNDSKATNPDAAMKGLSAMNRKTRLIIGGLDKKVSFDEWILMFNGKVTGAYIIGETKGQIIETLNKHDFKEYKVFNTLEEATLEAYNDAKQGECILLSPGCASWDMFESFEQRGELFKEVFKSLKE